MNDINHEAYEQVLKIPQPNSLLYLCWTPDEMSQSRVAPEKVWSDIEAKAKSLCKTLETDVPYSDVHIVGKHNGLDNGNISCIE
jgi:serine/threonine-protein phosphatase 2A regulatory subunit B'